MPKSEAKKKNHYIPRSHLKRWAGDDGRVWTYRILVSNPQVPLWKKSTPSGVAYHQHLYTRVAKGAAADEIENWLDKEFENPAASVIDKVLSQQKLTPGDWAVLIRYLACQDLRTPARLLESLKRQEDTMQSIMEGALSKVKKKLEEKDVDSSGPSAARFPGSELLPLHLLAEDDPESDQVKVEARTTTGRSAWLFSLKYMLHNSRGINALLSHRWTILRAPRGFSWCTSDTPVIRLNYFAPNKYDFKGGWGSDGTEIIFPLDPRNIMYTKIGEKPPRRGTVVSADFAHLLQRMIFENAHRFIFCNSNCDAVSQIRPRKENAAFFQNEQTQWLCKTLGNIKENHVSTRKTSHSASDRTRRYCHHALYT